MRFNFTAILATASAFTGVLAAPSATGNTAVAETQDLSGILDAHKASQPKLSAGAALDIVNKLQNELAPIETNLNKIAKSISSKSSKQQRQVAIASAKKDLTAMTQAVYKATEAVSTQSTAAKKGGSGGGDVQALAKALKHTLVTVSATVNTLLASLGLTPLLAFLTPVTASLSGLVITLLPVVDSLLPILNTILDGVVAGLSGLLAGLIL